MADAPPSSSSAFPADRRPLLERLRAAGASVPHLPLADLPTPLGELVLADGYSFWLKNDGAAAPVYGGNKARKLEWLLAEAQAQGATAVRTTGAIGSNHCVATAIHASRVGLRTELVQTPQPLNEHVRLNILAASCFSHRMTLVGDYRGVGPAMAWARLKDLFRRQRAYPIPMGGSSVTGTLGYVNAALEFAEQRARIGSAERLRIYLAAGTCGTLAGLVVGLELAELEAELVGVRVVDEAVTNEAVVAGLVDGTWAWLEALGLKRPAARVAWTLRHEGFGEGYGMGTPEGAAAQAELALHGLKTEGTYTAKAAAVMLSDLRGGRAPAQATVFWHTLNSQPLLTALPHDALTRVPAGYKPFFEVSR
jgi:D-cysteine desulfhydrase